MERHAVLGVSEGSTVVAGDSLASMMPVLDLFTALHNRGIGGTTIRQLSKRLPGMAPARRIVLQAGTNDLLLGHSLEDIEEAYAELFSIASGLPCEVVALSIPPMRHGAQPVIPPPEVVEEANLALRRQAMRFGVPVVDVTEHLADPDGLLAERFTRDGVHLVAAAYLQLAPVLEPLFR